MIEYNNLPQGLKTDLEMAVQSDPYGLRPETLYRNIYHSSGSTADLVKIFEVPYSLVLEIKDQK